jgi:hypothetical protein
MKRIHMKTKEYDDEKRIENNQEISLKKKNFTILNQMRRNLIHSSQKIALSLFFCWHILSFFVYFNHYFRFFFYILTSSLSFSILSKFNIIHLLNFLIFFVSMNNLKISDHFLIDEVFI